MSRVCVEKLCREGSGRNKCCFDCCSFVDLESSWLSSTNLLFSSCLTTRTLTFKSLCFDVFLYWQRFSNSHSLQTIPLTVNLRNFSCALLCPSDCLHSYGPHDASWKTYRSINILTFFPVTSFMLFLFAYTQLMAQKTEQTISEGTSEKRERERKKEKFVEIIMPVKV